MMAAILAEREFNSIVEELKKLHGKKVKGFWYGSYRNISMIYLFFDDDTHVTFDFEDYKGDKLSSFGIYFR